MKTTSKSKKKNLSRRISTSEGRLYDSIKHIGLIEPLVYVRNSDTQEFELYGGGRRRLKLLEAIRQEKEECGEKPVPATTVVRNLPVPSEKIELSHLIQNHVRRHRNFIDRALQLSDCIETKEVEMARPMSQRDSVKWLRENGFPISQSLLSDMQFTAKHLYPLLPQALCNGMGRRHILKIRKLYRAMREIWKAFGDDLEDCEEAFEDICNECDDANFDIDLFIEVLETEICLWCSLNSQYVRALLMVDSKARNRLIDSIRTTDKQNTPMTRSLRKRAPPPVDHRTPAEPRPKKTSLTFYLPPAVINRRKRYARRLALELAKSSDLLDCVSGSLNHTLGYHILSEPSTEHTTQATTWQFLHYCEQAVQSPERLAQRINSNWRSLGRKDFYNIRSLVEVTRSLYIARRVPKTAEPRDKAA